MIRAGRDFRGLTALWGFGLVVLSGLIVALGLISVRPDWHAHFHSFNPGHSHFGEHSHQSADEDDQEPDPHGDAACAIELFGNDQLDSVNPQISPTWLDEISTAPGAFLSVWEDGDSGLNPPSRAPPIRC